MEPELDCEQPLPPPPWQRAPHRPAKRRRDPITREAIVEAAIGVLDRDGLEGLNMRRVAEELNTGAASLYWHVGSKEGLLDLIFDQVIGEQEVPEPDPQHWQEQLKQVAREQRATTLRHRDIIRISLGRIPMGANALRHNERVLAILRAGGVPDHLAVIGQHLLIVAINGFTLDETAELHSDAHTVPGSEREVARDYIASLPAERFPNLIAVADHFAFADPDERFELLLDLFVDGLAKRASEAGARTEPA